MKKFILTFLLFIFACTPALADVLFDLPAGEYLVIPLEDREATASSCVRVAEGGKIIAEYGMGQQFTLAAGQAVMECNATVAEQLKPTTDSIITFRDIFWLSDDKYVIEQITEQFSNISISETKLAGKKSYSYSGNNTAYNFSDPESLYFPSLNTSEVTTKTVIFETDSTLTSTNKVAGYPIEGINLRFIDASEYPSEDEYVFFEAKYLFGNSADVSRIEQLHDLINKLTSLYGEPYTYSYDYSLSDYQITNLIAVWVGADETGIHLDYTQYLGETGILAGVETINLYYGTCAVNPLFQAGIDQELYHAQQEASATEKRRQEIFDDNSGL